MKHILIVLSLFFSLYTYAVESPKKSTSENIVMPVIVPPGVKAIPVDLPEEFKKQIKSHTSNLSNSSKHENAGKTILSNPELFPPNMVALEKWKEKQGPKAEKEEKKEYLEYQKRNLEFESIACCLLYTSYYGKPEIGVMNYLKYDLMTVGNNEFKLTTDNTWESKFFELTRLSKFPWLAANFVEISTGKLPIGISPFVILKLNNKKIAFFGVTAPRVQTYSHVNQKYLITDPIEVSKKLVSILRSRADIVIAVTHVGVCATSQAITLGTPCLDQELAAKVPGIDAILGGDSHTFLQKPLIICLLYTSVAFDIVFEHII